MRIEGEGERRVGKKDIGRQSVIIITTTAIIIIIIIIIIMISVFLERFSM